MQYRRLNQAEVIAAGVLNCSANALEVNIPALSRRLTEDETKALEGARKTISEIVCKLIHKTPDEDERERLERRILSLKATLSYVHLPMEEKVILSMKDASTLIWPCLERCNLDCPCVTEDEDGDLIGKTAAIKGCETRRTLVRAGVKGTGRSDLCPYYLTDVMEF